MTPDDFRRIALSLPETLEKGHQGHPDFRVCGKIFATLAYPDESFAMVKLTPEQQAAFVKSDPDAFTPVKGKWGLGGATNVRLKKIGKPALERALLTAWRNIAPKNLPGPYEPPTR